MAIFNGNALLASYKTSNYFYVAGRDPNDYEKFILTRSVDGKVWEDVNADAFEMTTINSITEVNGMLVVAGVGLTSNNKIILSTDDFASVTSYPLPYNVMQLEYAGGNNIVGSARLTNDSFVSPIYMTLNGLNAAPSIVIRLPGLKVSDWSSENTIYTNSDNTLTFYDGSTIYTSPDGLAWSSIAAFSAYWFRKHGEFYYYRRDELDTTVWQTKNTVYRTKDFKTVDVIYENVNKNPTPVSRGFQDFEDFVLWEIGSNTAYVIALDGTMTTITTSGVSTNTYPSGYMLNSSTGRRVMFGYNIQYYSDNGSAWSTGSMNNSVKDCYFYKGIFIITVQNGPYDLEMHHSTDGITWTQTTTPESLAGGAYEGFGFVEFKGELIFYKTYGNFTKIFWKTTNGTDWTIVNDYPNQNPNLTYANLRLVSTNVLNAFLKLDSSSILKTKTELSDSSWSGMSDDLLSNPISAASLGSDREGTVYFGPQYGINKDDVITKTSDAGLTFTTFKYPAERSQASSRMVTKIDGTLYATGTEYNEQGNAEIGLFRSSDWETWERIPVNVGGTFDGARFANMYFSYDSHKWVLACTLSQFYAASQILVASYNLVDWSMKTLNSTDSGAFIWKEIPQDTSYVQLNTGNMEFTNTIALGRNTLGSSPFSSTMSSNSLGTLWETNDVPNPVYNPNNFSMPIRASGKYFVTIGYKADEETMPYFILSETGKEWFETANRILIDPAVSYNRSPMATTDDLIYLFTSAYIPSEIGGPLYTDVKVLTYDYSGQLLNEKLIEEMTSTTDALDVYGVGMTNGILWVFTSQQRLAYSTDYTNWTVTTLPDDAPFIEPHFTSVGYIAGGPNKILLRSVNNRILVSEDNMATWSDFEWYEATDPDLEYYPLYISYSKLKSKYFILYGMYNPSTDVEVLALKESTDAVTWTDVELPDYEMDGIRYYILSFACTDNFDMFIAADDSNLALGVWILTDSGWVESDLGDSLRGYYVGGTYDNVPNFRGLMVEPTLKSTLILCSASGSGPET